MRHLKSELEAGVPAKPVVGDIQGWGAAGCHAGGRWNERTTADGARGRVVLPAVFSDHAVRMQERQLAKSEKGRGGGGVAGGGGAGGGVAGVFAES